MTAFSKKKHPLITISWFVINNIICRHDKTILYDLNNMCANICLLWDSTSFRNSHANNLSYRHWFNFPIVRRFQCAYLAFLIFQINGLFAFKKIVVFLIKGAVKVFFFLNFLARSKSLCLTLLYKKFHTLLVKFFSDKKILCLILNLILYAYTRFKLTIVNLKKFKRLNLLIWVNCFRNFLFTEYLKSKFQVLRHQRRCILRNPCKTVEPKRLYVDLYKESR